jgi:hypothetical protein
MATAWGQGKVVGTHEDLSGSAFLIAGFLGDVNFDALVDVRDVMLCMRMVAELPLPREPSEVYRHWAADMSGDEEIGVDDALRILYASLGRPAGKPLPSSWEREAVVRVGEVRRTSVDMITVPVLVQDRRDVCAAGVRLTYDSEHLTPVEVRAGTSDALLAANTDPEGQIIAALVSTKGVVSSEGRLLSVDFLVEGKREDEDIIHFEQVHLFDVSAAAMEVRIGSPLVSTERVIPQTYGLFQNVPNPFNVHTMIGYDLPEPTHVRLTIYSLTGQQVATVVSRHQEAGRYKVRWDASGLANGIYLYRLEAGRYTKTKRLVLLK